MFNSILNFFHPPIRLFVEDVIRNLKENPDNWSSSPYRITNGEINFWIANGLFCFEMENPFTMSLNWREKRILWQAINEWKADMISIKLKGVKDE